MPGGLQDKNDDMMMRPTAQFGAKPGPSMGGPGMPGKPTGPGMGMRN